MKTSISILSLLLSATLISNAGAADMPKRKAGLWEVHTQMDNMPRNMAIQMCVDQTSDNLMQQRGKDKADCSTMNVKKNANNTTVHAVCRSEGSTMTMDAVYTGSFDSGYRADMKMHYDPPQHGMSDMHMVQDAKWLGPCKAGQKAGDVVMPNMGNFNVNEMMKDPRLQEMMKRQQDQDQ